MEHVRRIVASPFAKRLARERGLDLAALEGSGPNGRIVAADLPDEAAAVEPPPAAPERADRSAAPAVRPAAFTVTTDLRPAEALLETLETAGLVFDVQDVLLRAAAHSLGVGFGHESTIVLELAGRRRRIADAPRSMLSALRKCRLDGAAEPVEAGAGTLGLRFIACEGIRPTMLPLAGGEAMRLVVTIDVGRSVADCLLIFDPQAVDEENAISLLDAMRRSLEAPLRLLA